VRALGQQGPAALPESAQLSRPRTRAVHERLARLAAHGPVMTRLKIGAAPVIPLTRASAAGDVATKTATVRSRVKRRPVVT
jgi:predicted transcriptional regulator